MTTATSLDPVAWDDRLPYLANDVLRLIVMPTEQCNLRCVYCYESFEIGRMGDDTAQGIRRLLTRRAPGLSRLRLDWFGGEPLLAADRIEEIQEHASALAARHGFTLEAEATTNAVMLDAERLHRFAARGLRRYQISLDGPPEEHDRKRTGAGGRATFATIWRNVRTALESDLELEILLRVHVDRDNAASIPRLLAMCRDELPWDERIRLFLRPLSRLGGPNDARLRILGAEKDQVLADLREQARRLGLGAGYAGPEGVAVCYAAAANAFVVRADGGVSRCTVALDDPRNRIGRLTPEGRLELDTMAQEPWLRGLLDGDARALTCPLKALRSDTAGASPLRVVA
ncbi:MAG: radical SAM protein [Acidobacteriota bacterium]